MIQQLPNVQPTDQVLLRIHDSFCFLAQNIIGRKIFRNIQYSWILRRFRRFYQCRYIQDRRI